MSNLYAINPPTLIPPRPPVNRGGVFTGKIEIVPTPSSRKLQRDSYDSSMAHTSLTPILQQIAIPSPSQSSSTSTSLISSNHQPQTSSVDLVRSSSQLMTPSLPTNRLTELEALTRALVESNAVSAAAARDAAAAAKEAIAAAKETEA